MAKRMAFMPEELISSHHMQNSETRIEDEIDNLLERNKLPDDMKARLLSQLITRYHKIIATPPEPVRVSVVEDEDKNDSKHNVGKYHKDSERKHSDMSNDPIIDDIQLSIPQQNRKYIYFILEKLKTRSYSWNENGEFTEDGVPFKNSQIVDLFSYLMRNSKHQTKPKYFDKFFTALQEVNIPINWIGNKKVLKDFLDSLRVHTESPPKKWIIGETSLTPQLEDQTPIRKRKAKSTPSRTLIVRKWLDYEKT